MKLDQHSLLEGTKLVVLISYLPPTLVNRLRLLEGGKKSNFVQAKRNRSRQGGKKMQMQVRRERREGGGAPQPTL